MADNVSISGVPNSQMRQPLEISLSYPEFFDPGADVVLPWSHLNIYVSTFT
jgi:hypothetical protein